MRAASFKVPVIVAMLLVARDTALAQAPAASDTELTIIARASSTRIPLSFVSPDSLRQLPRHDPAAYWNAFFAAFPGSRGLITVSRPGIAADGQSAVVSIGMGCGGLCGTWGYALLRKDGDRWRVVRYIVNRVS